MPHRRKPDRHGDRAQLAAAREAMLDEVSAYALAELRRDRGLSRKQVAEQIESSKSKVTRLEAGKLSDVELRVMQEYVAAIGGKLRVVVEFPDRIVSLR